MVSHELLLKRHLILPTSDWSLEHETKAVDQREDEAVGQFDFTPRHCHPPFTTHSFTHSQALHITTRLCPLTVSASPSLTSESPLPALSEIYYLP